MADPVLAVRVAARMDEFKRNMQEGIAQIETTKTHMTSMAKSFDGSRILSQAGAVQAQIQSLGGASQLTASEQAKANRILEEALDKYRALGREAPPGMQQLADETRQVDVTSSRLTDTVKRLAIGFVAMFTARAGFNFAAATIREAGALDDLAKQTRINVEELQVLTGALSESGITADETARGLFNLSRRIAGGEDGVVEALDKMGMSLESVRDLQGEALLLEILGGLKTLQGTMRDDVSAELFGSRMGRVMGGAAEEIERNIETWRDLHVVMSEESIKALGQYEDAINRTMRTISAIAANAMGPLAEGFNTVTDAAIKGAGKFDIFVAMLKDFAASNTVTGASTTHLATLLDELNQTTETGTAKAKAATVVNKETAASFEARAESAKKAAKAEEEAAKALAENEKAYASLMSTIKNERGMAQMEEAAATLQRAAENANQLWMMERDAWQLAFAEKKRLREEELVAEAEWREVMGDGLLIIGQLEAAYGSVGEAAVSSARRAEMSWTEAIGAAHAGLGAMTGQVQAAMTLEQVKRAAKDVGGVAHFDDFNNPYVHIPGVNAPGTPVPGRAMGGPVSAGSPYMVGERGPEMFVPRQSGSIVSHGGGGVTIAPVLHFHGPVIGSSMEFEATVAEALLKLLKSGAVQMPA